MSPPLQKTAPTSRIARRATWAAVLRQVGQAAISDRISLVAAGCAFYAMLALFPAISMLVLIAGLAFDPAHIEPQIEVLRGLLPEESFALISARLHTLVAARGKLQLGIVISGAITLWSAMSGMKALIAALNLAYHETEARGFFTFQLLSLLFTLGSIVAALLGLSALVALPAALALLGVPESDSALIRMATIAALLCLVMLALGVLYRIAPSRRLKRWHWVTPGTVLAALLWGAASWAFSLYVSKLGTYDVTYGPLGAVIGLLMWFWVSAFVILLGAEVNAALERQLDSDGQPNEPE